ncbi:MAG: MATE family efflux transporter, partial [Mesorhizobium sp.]
GLQMIVISAAALTVMGIVNSYGSQVAAAYGIAAQLWTYIQMPAQAIGAAVSSMAAQNVGAGRWDRIGKVAASGVGFNLVLTGALVALLLLIILIISVLIIRTGFAYSVRSVIGQEALWWSFPAGSIASLVLAAAYYRFGRWRTTHMIEGRPAAGEPPDT